jgi:hypothetical protein
MYLPHLYWMLFLFHFPQGSNDTEIWVSGVLCSQICGMHVLDRLLDMYLNPGEGREPMHGAAVRLLHCHGASLDPLKVLEVCLQHWSESSFNLKFNNPSLMG